MISIEKEETGLTYLVRLSVSDKSLNPRKEETKLAILVNQ